MGVKSVAVYPGSIFTCVAFAEQMALFYFGPARAADTVGRYISRAYRDMNRTLRFAGISQGERDRIRTDCTEILRRSLMSLAAGDVKPDAAGSDRWHMQTCDALRARYSDARVTFTYGQAQKWVNMTVKYVFVAIALDILPGTWLGLRQFYVFAHLPLDRQVLAALRRSDVSAALPDTTWSAHDDYDQYLALQKKVRERWGCGLDAELQLWRPAQGEWAREAFAVEVEPSV